MLYDMAHWLNHTRTPDPKTAAQFFCPPPLSHAVHSLPSKQFPIPVIGMHLKRCAIARLVTGHGRTVRELRRRLPTDR